MVRMRVKEQNPLQKPQVSPRFKMAQSGQGRQRLKALLLLDRARKEPLFPSAKIRSRWMSHQIFGATVLRFPIVGTIRSRSIVANMILARLLLELVRGFGIPASSSLPSLAPPGCLRFFFSSITGTTQVPLLLLLFHHWCHPDLPRRCQSRIEGFIVPAYFLCYNFFIFSQLMILGLSKPLYVYCTISLSNKR